MNTFVRVSRRDPRYLECSDGTPYVPIGFNLVGVPAPEEFEPIVTRMAENGINFVRVWVGHTVFDVEHEKSGTYDLAPLAHLRRFLALARERGIRVKLCLEFFRDIPAESTLWSDRPLHHSANGGPFDGMEDFLSSAHGLAQFKRKLAWYREHLGDDPAVFGWELWNEMNCVRGDWIPWTRTMLAELHRLFPRHLAMQSLGSFDAEGKRAMYQTLCHMPGNDLAQVHRYLDLGAPWSVCHEAVDVLAAHAIDEIAAMNPAQPILLAESGAVEPRHSGPFRGFATDDAGSILHDVIWTPFFAGAAGTGHIWYWREYLAAKDLWWHFARFATAVEGLDPAAESFELLRFEAGRLRAYALSGKHTFIAWCRDADSDWRSELSEGKAPAAINGAAIPLPRDRSEHAFVRRRTYDPWRDLWQAAAVENGVIELPDFSRSIVVRFDAAL